MTLQSELNHVTDLVISRRRDLAEAEIRRLAAKRAADLAAEELETARRQLMTRAEAGSNDTQRRAYAERESRRERDHADRKVDDLLAVEAAVIRATVELRMAEDERRYLEFVARLAIAGVNDEATDDSGERYTLADANRDLF